MAIAVRSGDPLVRFALVGWLRWSVVAAAVMALLAFALVRVTDQDGFAVAPWLPLGMALSLGAVVFAFRCEQTGDVLAWQTAAPSSRPLFVRVIALVALLQLPCAFLDGDAGRSRAVGGQVVASVDGDLLWQFHRAGQPTAILFGADGTVRTVAPADSSFAPAPADPRRHRRVSLLARAVFSPARDALDPGWLRWALLTWSAVAPALVLCGMGRWPAQQLLVLLLPFGAVAWA